MSKVAKVGWAMDRLKYAETVMYRKNLFDDAVTAAEKEMAKIPDSEKSDPCVLEEIEKFQKALAELRTKYVERELKNEWDELERKVKARWQDINNLHWPRFPDRTDAALAEIKKALEQIRTKFTGSSVVPDAIPFAEEWESQLRSFDNKRANHVLQQEWDKAIQSIKYQWSQAETNCPRFMDRVATACDEAKKPLDNLEADLSKFEPLFVDAPQKPEDILREWKEKFDGMRVKAAQEKYDKEVRDAISYPNTILNGAVDYLTRYGLYGNQALNKMADAIDAKNKLVEKPEWRGIPRWEEFKDNWDATVAKFNEQVAKTEIEELLKDKTNYAFTLYDMALNDVKRQGLYQGIAMGRLQDARDYKLDIVGIEKLHGHPKFNEFLEKTDAKEKEFWKYYEEAEFQEFMRNTCLGGAKQTLGFCDSYLRSSVAQAMDYYHQAVEQAEAIAKHEKYGRHPEVLAFLADFEKQRAAWKAKVDEEELVKAIRDATSNALTNLSHANTYFKSGHEGQALDYFSQAKDQAKLVGEEPRFIGRPEIPAFFDKFNTEAQSFQTLYRDTVLSKKVKDATSTALQNLENSFSYLKGHESQALEYFATANGQFSDVISNPEFVGLPQREEFISKFEARAKEFQETYAAMVLNSEIRESTQTLKQTLSNANTYFSSHRYDQAMEFFHETRSKLSDLQFNPRLNAQPEVVQCITEVERGLDEFDKKFTETVTRNQLRDEIQSAKQALSNASSTFIRSQSQALEELVNAKQLGLKVSSNPAYASIPEAIEFNNAFPAAVIAVQDDFDHKILQQSVKEAVEDLKLALHLATVGSETAPESQVLSRLEEAKSKREQLGRNSTLLNSALGSQVQDALAKFDQEYSTFKNNYSAKIMASTVKAALERPKTALSHANTYFESYRYDQALGYLREAYDEIGKIAADPTLNDIPEVIAYFDTFNQGASAFKEKYDARQREEAIKKAKAQVSDNVSHAKTYFDSFRRDQALEYIQQGTAALEDYKVQFPVDGSEPDPWVQKMEDEIKEFQKKYVETVLREELNKAKSSCTEPLSRVQGAIDRKDIASALRDLELGQDASKVLGSDARFLSSKEVDDFLAETQKRINELKAKLDTYLDEERRSKRRDTASTLLNNAKIYFTSRMCGQAFGFLQEGRDLITDIEADASDKDSSFVAEWRSKAAEFEAACQKTLFEEEVKALLQTPTTHLATSEFYLKTGNYDQANEVFSQAKEAALVLAEPKYLAMKEVQEWFEDWGKKTKDFQTRFDNAVYATEANKFKSNVSLYVSQAQFNFSQRSYDRALESLTQAKEALDAIRQNEAVLRVAGVEQFVQETEKSLKETQEKFNATIFNDAMRQKISDSERVLASAKQLLERHAYARALEEFNAANESINELKSDARFNTQPTVVAFVQKVEKDLKEFSSKYAASQLVDESRQHVSNVRTELTLARTYLDRGAGDQAFKHLVEARAKSIPLSSNAMFQTLEQVPALLAELAKTEEEYAQKELTKSANEIVRTASAHLKQVAQFEKVQAKAKALEQLQEAEKAAVEVLDNNLYASIPAVKAFKDEFQAAAERHRYTRKGKGAEGAAAEAGPVDTATVAGVVGGLIPYPDLRFKSITISTDINPKIFNAVKKFNEIGGRINSEVRKAYRFAGAVKLDDLSEYVRVIASDPSDTIRRELDDINKQSTRYISQDAPEDPVGKQILEEVVTFTKHWTETQERWKRAVEIHQQMHAIAKLLGFASESIKHYEGLMKTTYTVASWNNSVGMFDSSIPMKSNDYDCCLQAITATESAVSLVERFEASNNGVAIPKKNIFLTRAKEFKKKAIDLHPYLCIHQLLNTAGNMGARIPVYWEALRRFPKARATAIKQHDEIVAQRYERRPWDRKTEEGNWHSIVDPYEGQTISDAFEETIDYHPAAEYEIIRPNDPSLPVRQQKSVKDSKLWTDLHKKWAGKIVFSNSPIDANSPNEGDTKSTFAGNEEIYARAFWPHAIAQIAVAKKKSDGSPVYPFKYLFNRNGFNDKHILEIAQIVTIDGVRQQREAQPEGAFTWFSDIGQRGDEKSYEAKIGQTTDFYAFNQSCSVLISRKEVKDPATDWQTASNRYQLVLSHLPPGEHKVKIDIVYRLVSTHNNESQFVKVFPPFTTPWSHPIASGEFTINTSSIPITLGSIFPKRQTTLAANVAKEYEGLIIKLLQNNSGWGARASKTEVPFHVVLTGDWFPSATGWFKCGNTLVEETTQWGINFTALFYRSPTTGWNHEEVRGFYLSAYTNQVRGQKAEPPFVQIGVGGNFGFDVDLLPPDVIATAFKRCPENLRSGIF